MKKIINKAVLISLIPILVAGIFAVPATQAQAAIDFNSVSNEGIRILQVANSTKDAGTANWQNYSVNANAGEVIGLLIHYHNFTSGETAQNTRISVNSPSGSSSTHTISVNLRADNSATFPNSVNINLSSNQSLSFINGSARWIPGNQGSTAFPFGQSGNEINTASGVNIGSVAYGDAQSGYLTLKIQVSSNGNQTNNLMPTVTTNSVANMTQYSADFNGSVNPNGSSANAWFEYGASSSNLNNTTNQTSVGSGNSSVNFSRYVSGLNANTIYYYRAAAQNSYGTSYGSILNFVTGSNNNNNPIIGCSPIVSTNIASFVTSNSASLKGFVNPRNRYTNTWFEWGASYALGNRTNSQYVNNTDSNVDIIGYLTNLAPNTNYYFRVVGENDCGREYGVTTSFRTSVNWTPAPTPTPTPTPTPAPSSATRLAVWKETKNLSFPNGTALVNSATVGDTIEYSLYIKNIGNYTLYNVVVKDVLPSQFEFVESNPKIDRDSSGDTLIWNIGSIDSGETAVISLKIKTRSVDESVVIYNSFIAQVNGISRTSDKTMLILNPQRNICAVVTPSAGLGISQFAAAVANFTIGGLSIWFYLAIILILLYIAGFFYRRYQQKQIFNLRA